MGSEGGGGGGGGRSVLGGARLGKWGETVGTVGHHSRWFVTASHSPQSPDSGAPPPDGWRRGRGQRSR